MSYILGYEHDIFVSYAHDDNKPMFGARAGWISIFVDNLKVRLRQKVRDNQAVSLWMDPDLARYVDFEAQLYDKVQRSASLLVFLSRAYLRSNWCPFERQAFSKSIEDSALKKPIFLVELDQVPLDDRPPEFANLLPYRLWVERTEGKTRTLGFPEPVPTDYGYYDQLADLATDLCEELQRQRDAARPLAAPAPGGEAPIMRSGPLVAPATHANGKHCVYLAEVTDDLELLRDEACRYLDQFDLRVLPDEPYPRGANEFQAAVERDLSRSILYAQILSDVPGKKLPGTELTYVSAQHSRAIALEKPILQWRRPDVQPDKIIHDAHRTLVAGSTVMASDFEAYKAELVKMVRQIVEPPASPAHVQAAPDDSFVFVNHDIDDLPLAQQVCDLLASSG